MEALCAPDHGARRTRWILTAGRAARERIALMMATQRERGAMMMATPIVASRGCTAAPDRV
jgi:hypothetical protein